MKKVRREEILNLHGYEERRDAMRKRIFEVKAARRIHLGDCLTFLFENADTVRYQVHEMMRAERLIKDDDIQREVDTYNELLGTEGELGCTLLIELDDPEERAVKLRAWRDLPEHLYAKLKDGRRIRPTLDERQRDEERLSAVQFLKFDTGGEVPVALGSDYGDLAAEVTLTEEQRAALADDLAA
ncbi:MAG: DUF3501 family protein [Planctomycetota bacterium]|jgi:hypothetical protein